MTYKLPSTLVSRPLGSCTPVSPTDKMFKVQCPTNMLSAVIRSWNSAGMPVSSGDLFDAKAVRTHRILIGQKFLSALNEGETVQTSRRRESGVSEAKSAVSLNQIKSMFS